MIIGKLLLMFASSSDFNREAMLESLISSSEVIVVQSELGHSVAKKLNG